MKAGNYLIWIVIFLLIIIRYFALKPKYMNGDKIRITAIVHSDPISFEKSQYIKVAGLKVYLPLFPRVTYGDKIILVGVVSDGKLTNPRIDSIASSSVGLVKFRNNIIDFYNRSLNQPESGLLAGITLGAKSSLVNDFYEQTKKVGLTHVVVASGTNITFVISFMMGVFTRFMSRKRSIYFCILGIVLYLILSGFEAPLIRASLMASILFLSQETGRLGNSWRILILTGALMLIVNPNWIFDIGFILSFASTASIMLFNSKIDKKVNFLPSFIRESVSTSISAQIGVAPIIFVTFGQFNPLSFVANALVLWTIPFIMILGAISAVVHLKLFVYLSYPFLWWFTTIVELFSF